MTPMKIPGQLGHFGQGPDEGLFGIWSGAGRPDNFRQFRKGGTIDGQSAHRGNTCVEGEIVQIEFDAVSGELGDQFAADRILDGCYFNDRRRDFVMVDLGADMTLDFSISFSRAS